jgi:hypothetical protein
VRHAGSLTVASQSVPQFADVACVSILHVMCLSVAKKHNYWRIKRAPEGPAPDAVSEAGQIAVDLGFSSQARQLIDELTCQQVVGVESQNPLRLNGRVLNREIPLLRMGVKGALGTNALVFYCAPLRPYCPYCSYRPQQHQMPIRVVRASYRNSPLIIGEKNGSDLLHHSLSSLEQALLSDRIN